MEVGMREQALSSLPREQRQDALSEGKTQKEPKEAS